MDGFVIGDFEQFLQFKGLVIKEYMIQCILEIGCKVGAFGEFLIFIAGGSSIEFIGVVKADFFLHIFFHVAVDVFHVFDTLLTEEFHSLSGWFDQMGHIIDIVVVGF